MNDVRISVSVEKKHVEDGVRASLTESPTSLAVCEKLGAEQVYSRPRQIVHQDHNPSRKEYYTVKDVSYNPYFGVLYSGGDPSSVRKFVCATHDKNRVGEFMQMIDYGRDVDHLLPFQFELVEVSA